MLRSTFSIILTFIVFISVVSLTSQSCLAIVKGDAELLKVVALKHKSNFEALLTWKGEAFEERTSTQGDTYNYMLKSKFTLAYNQLQNAVRWNMEPQEYHAENNGVRFKSSMSRYNSGLITDQASYTYRCSGTDAKGNEIYRVIIAGPERGVKEAAHSGLDPRYFYNDAGTIDIYSRLMFLYEQANNPKLTERHVKREGNHVIMTLEKKTDEGGTRTQKYVFDLSAGGNVVEFYNSGLNYENHRKYEYEEKSGVWVLKSYKKWNTTYHNGNKEPLKSTRTITWNNSVVNIPFEEDEFTLAKMGVRVGDDIQDERLGMLYKYGGVVAEVPPKPQTLIGKQLPQTDGFGIPLTPDSTKDKIVLFCFWDMKQRPSRQCVRELANRTDDLKKKGIVSILIHASPADPNAMNEWMTKFKIPSPCGVITGDAAKVETIRCKWGVRGLPWLILTDKRHLVQAEGFGINDLDEKITALMEE
jgi:hypothetical protein